MWQWETMRRVLTRQRLLAIATSSIVTLVAAWYFPAVFQVGADQTHNNIGGWIAGFISPLRSAIEANPLLDVVVVGLLLFAVVFWMLYRLDKMIRGMPLLIATMFSDAEISSNQEPEDDTKSEDMIMVPVRPDHIQNLMKGHTQVQIDALVKPYIGNWIEITGPLENFHKGDWTDAYAQIRYPIDPDGKPYPHLFANMDFKDRWITELAMIPIGQTIKVKGKIERIDQGSIALHHCRLPPFGPPTKSTRQP